MFDSKFTNWQGKFGNEESNELDGFTYFDESCMTQSKFVKFFPSVNFPILQQPISSGT